MPVGIQRLNASPQPSSQIIFIKPLPGPNSRYAQDFLERIAAICHPIMKANHLSIMTLEEHEPNSEFIGRNFNAGDIIQLVLKAPYSGHWLPFRSVQMVMMHELAHCMQMNHSGAFWKVNNQFKGDLRELWAKGYTGDGLWGRGQTLLSGEYDTGRSVGDEMLPRNLCGGTFRSSRRGKRKRAWSAGGSTKETYAERQQRRIARKFGVNGSSLGGDEDTRMQLEKGVKVKGKPKVANSSRGRELRVAAALARFGQQKEEAKSKEDDVEKSSKRGNWIESDDESDYEEIENKDVALDLDGSELRDGHGRNMVRICEGADKDDVHVKREMAEIKQLDDAESQSPREDSQPYSDKAENPLNVCGSRTVPSPRAESDERQSSIAPKRTLSGPSNIKSYTASSTGLSIRGCEFHPNDETVCPICSMSNDPFSPLCIACSNVLDTTKVTKFWKCQSDACKDSSYINAADVGLCGVCGARKRVEDG